MVREFTQIHPTHLKKESRIFNAKSTDFDKSSYFGLSPLLERFFISIWLLFVTHPILELLTKHDDLSHKRIVLTGVATFVIVYLVLIWKNTRTESHAQGTDTILLIALTLLAPAITLSDGSSWEILFFFVGSGLGLRLLARYATWAICGVALLAISVGWVVDAGWITTGTTVLVVCGLGFGMMGSVRMGETIRALRQAKEQIAQLAASEAITKERLRFARDLHDLLGHSLSLITLKSELASRLASTAPHRAISEIHDIESVAREALREVRQAVLNYRQPTLMTELEGAEEMLLAAGVSCKIAYQREALSPAIEAVLAWTVREAVTNVIRHAHAKNCEIIVERVGTAIRVRIRNDGCDLQTKQTSIPTEAGGNGLTGVAERVSGVLGQLTTGQSGTGWFCLDVTVPIEANS